MYKEQEIKDNFRSEKGMSPELLSELVQRVLYLIAQRLNEQKQQDEYVVAVFTGATAGFKEALSGLEQLMMSGIQVRIVLSDSAQCIYGNRIQERLLPWPTASLMDGESWFCDLKAAKGVVVPMLSVSALSKVCGLIADTLTTNLILQALFMGKPVVAAINGCEPGNSDRKTLGLDSGTQALQRALGEQLIRLSDYGCNLVRSSDLGRVCGRLVNEKSEKDDLSINPENKIISLQEIPEATNGGPLIATLVDAGLVRRALREKIVISIGARGVITPLALELAQVQGLQIIKQ